MQKGAFSKFHPKSKKKKKSREWKRYKWRVEGKGMKGRLGGMKRRFSFRPLSGYTIQEPIMGVILSVADSFAPRCIRQTVAHGDVRAPIRYCVPLAMQQAAQYTAWQRVPPEPSGAGVYLLPWNDRRIPFSPFSASPREGQSRSRAITSAQARNPTLSLSLTLSFCGRSYKSSAARSVSIRGFHWQSRFLRMICRQG